MKHTKQINISNTRHSEFVSGSTKIDTEINSVGHKTVISSLSRNLFKIISSSVILSEAKNPFKSILLKLINIGKIILENYNTNNSKQKINNPNPISYKLIASSLSKTYGFTLVELIVVITILAILGTIAFISFGNYSSSARDSKRITNVSILTKGFGLSIAAGKTINTSETSVTPNISISGTTVTFTGYYDSPIKPKLLMSIGITSEELQTSDGFQSYRYTYIPTNQQYQIMSLLENKPSSALEIKNGKYNIENNKLVENQKLNIENNKLVESGKYKVESNSIISNNILAISHKLLANSLNNILNSGFSVLNSSYAETNSGTTGYTFIKGNYSLAGGINSLIPSPTVCDITNSGTTCFGINGSTGTLVPGEEIGSIPTEDAPLIPSCATEPSYTNATFTTGTPISENEAWQNINRGNACYFECINGTVWNGTSCSVDTSNTVLLLHFDDNLNNSGTNTGTVTNNNGATYTTGKFGKAMSFNGTNQYLSIPDSDDWTFGSDDFTIDFWVNFNSLSGPQIIYMQSDIDWNNYISIVKQSDNKLRLQVRNTSGTNWEWDTSNAIFSDIGIWQHVSIVRSGNTCFMYLDGISKPVSIAGTPTTIPNINGIVNIGTFSITSQLYLNGYLDEFRIIKGKAVWTGTTFAIPVNSY